jgi:hypothetical protein
MGMGPMISMPQAMLEDLPNQLKSIGIGCRELVPKHRLPVKKTLRFSRFLAATDADVRDCGPGEVSVHLVCAHGLNPLMWWPEMRLLNRIEKHLTDNGAAPCSIEKCFGDGQEAKHRGV